MITDYTSLQAAVADWLVRDDLTAVLPTFIQLAERKIHRDLASRADKPLLRAMEQEEVINVTSATSTLPSGFMRVRRLYLDDFLGDPLDYVTPYELRHMKREPDRPVAFTIEGDDLVISPSPEQSYTAYLLYYAEFEALSTTVATNWLLDNAPDVYLFAALLQAEPYIGNDERISIWVAQYESALETLIASDVNNRIGDSPLIARPEGGTP